MDEWLRRSGQHYRDPLDVGKMAAKRCGGNAQAERGAPPPRPRTWASAPARTTFPSGEYTDAELEALLYTDLDEAGEGVTTLGAARSA